jgi:hypothetical protein
MIRRKAQLRLMERNCQLALTRGASMSSRWILLAALTTIFCIPQSARAQQSAVDVYGCALAQHPKTYDRKLVRVRGALNVEFEDFTFDYGKCETTQSIWLAFGGDVPGIVASTVNDNDRAPRTDINVDGVPIAIRKDANFRRLYALITSRRGNKPRYRVTATLTGMFFAGRETKFADGGSGYVGYGHLGCCSLLVITSVSDVKSVPPANLDLRGVVVGLNRKPLTGITVIDDTLGGSPPVRQTAVTDERGGFSFSDSGEQLRIEDPQYRPMAITVQPGGKPGQVGLENAKDSDWAIGACGPRGARKRVGYSILFTVPTGMKSSKVESGDVHSFFVFPRGSDEARANLIISQVRNPAIDGTDSIGARRVTERWIKDASGKVIGIDARGRSADHGEYFRSLNFSSGDVAGYSGLRAGKQLTIANQVIDSACIANAPGFP